MRNGGSHEPKHYADESHENVIMPVDRQSQMATARVILQYHLIAESTGRCIRCGEVGPCSARVAAMQIMEPNERAMPEPVPPTYDDTIPEIKWRNGRMFRRVA